MIRRHPYRALAIAAAVIAAGPTIAWLAALEVWWAYQGRKRFGP